MIYRDAHLVENPFDLTALEKKPTRDGFGKGLVEAGEKDPRVVVLCADLADSTRAQWFRDKFPDRYIELGVAEQNMATVASGLANYGKIPFMASYAAFNPGRNNEQIRTTIALNNVPVKIVGSHGGISVAQDGATHQALEDVGLMRMQPNMVVIVPVDAEEARKATYAAAFNGAPTYLRYTRDNRPVFTTADSPFEIGRANLLWDGNPEGDLDVAVIGCSPVLHNALMAVKELAEERGLKIAVLNCHTIKPLDRDAIVGIAKRAGAVVTAEEHQIAGGMGSAIAELLVQEHPVPIEFVGVHDRFGQSGTVEELFKEYGLDASHIKEAIVRVHGRKQALN
ncbi:MAG: transketolase C-terminal domain-containing protein [bacterium]|nr:transketolase C-terminal domain-containing protein [bacterium]MDZ4285175.1 transketolase C-terminal domain-containing protein [Patescibacteria group bacterium]